MPLGFRQPAAFVESIRQTFGMTPTISSWNIGAVRGRRGMSGA